MNAENTLEKWNSIQYLEKLSSFHSHKIERLSTKLHNIHKFSHLSIVRLNWRINAKKCASIPSNHSNSTEVPKKPNKNIQTIR